MLFPALFSLPTEKNMAQKALPVDSCSHFQAERDQVGTALWSRVHVIIVVVQDPPPPLADPLLGWPGITLSHDDHVTPSMVGVLGLYADEASCC